MKQGKRNEPVLPEVKLEPSAIKTKKYLQYLIGEVFKHSPLMPNKIVPVDISENTDCFPEISEIVVGKVANDSEIIKNLYNEKLTKSYSEQRTKIANQLANKDWRGQLKLSELERFTKEIIKAWSPLQNFRPITYDPLNVRCEIIIGNAKKLLDAANELKVPIPPELIITGLEYLKTAKFIDNTPKIKWGHAIIDLGGDRFDTDICREAFNFDPLEEISWDIVLEKVDTARFNKAKDIAMKSVSDAIIRLNKIIVAKTGKELFVWKNKGFYRIA